MIHVLLAKACSVFVRRAEEQIRMSERGLEHMWDSLWVDVAHVTAVVDNVLPSLDKTGFLSIHHRPEYLVVIVMSIVDGG